MSIQIAANKRKELSGTFTLNKKKPIHRWYQYAEGYSSHFVENELLLIKESISSIYDPFGGSGTTSLVASQNGVKSYYSETNPFMAYICNTKINVTYQAYSDISFVLSQLKELRDAVVLTNQKEYNNIRVAFEGFEKYFEPRVLKKLVDLKSLISQICTDKRSFALAQVAIASIVVKVSNMVRRGDLRYATSKEKIKKDFDVFSQYTNTLNMIIDDLMININNENMSNTVFLCEDARDAVIEDKVDCVITSPPYLNGTNYVRNTKLELKLLDFIKTEKDLPQLHSKGIMAGINSVSKRRNIPVVVNEVKPYLNKLEPVAYDKRILTMINGYFYDMEKVIKGISENLINRGIFIMDIGDSQFAGVHIPTHNILSSIAQKYGFKLYDEETLRTRRSKNQMLLSQRILRYRLEK